MLATSNDWNVDAAVRHVVWCGVTCHPADAADEQWLRRGCSSPSWTVVRCYLPPSRCWRRAMSEVWMQQSVMYCSKVLPATRHKQCLRCGCNSPSCTVVLCAADTLTSWESIYSLTRGTKISALSSLHTPGWRKRTSGHENSLNQSPPLMINRQTYNQHVYR